MDALKRAETKEGLGSTARRDNWWVEPMLVGCGFALFIVYATFRAFEGKFYEWGPYLSPFYSPKLAFDWWHWSPAILILWVPAGFRATCYYYRKAYYRAYFMDPPACSVGHSERNIFDICRTKLFGGDEKYSGETTFPLVMQNLHRYFLYVAIIVVGFLWYDAIVAFNFAGSFHVGVGSLIMLANVLLLSAYTFGCHAFRHLVGGRLDCFSCTAFTQAQHGIWAKVTKLNEHHMLWAWLSLFSVGFTDFYIRMVSAGVFTDIRLF
jgi:hypothetical protein